MIRCLLIAALICGLTSPASAATTIAPVRALVAASQPEGQLQLFATEESAQAHCPRDVVVWLNTKSAIYHEKGMRSYGRTKHGAYVCRKEADSAGDRDTRNGQ